MPTPIQTELPLSAARIKRPMMKRDGARSVLDVEDWQLEALIDSKLTGILNVAATKVSRRDLRFAVVCLAEHVRDIRITRTDADLAELIFGKPQPLVRARWFYSRLAIKHSQFYTLVKERVIRPAKNSEQRTGPGGGLIVEWPEIVRFISERRIA